MDSSKIKGCEATPTRDGDMPIMENTRKIAFRSQLTVNSYDFVALRDHTFRADDVLPGTYELTVQVHTPFTPQNPRTQPLAEGTVQLVVPASPPCPTDLPVNLGEIKTNAIAK